MHCASPVERPQARQVCCVEKLTRETSPSSSNRSTSCGTGSQPTAPELFLCSASRHSTGEACSRLVAVACTRLAVNPISEAQYTCRLSQGFSCVSRYAGVWFRHVHASDLWYEGAGLVPIVFGAQLGSGNLNCVSCVGYLQRASRWPVDPVCSAGSSLSVRAKTTGDFPAAEVVFSSESSSSTPGLAKGAGPSCQGVEVGYGHRLVGRRSCWLVGNAPLLSDCDAARNASGSCPFSFGLISTRAIL